MQPPYFPIAGPWITEEDVQAVATACLEDWYQQANQTISAFEAAFAKTCHRQYAVALPSCTSAIHLALSAQGITQGDEVLLPESTWIASAAPVDYVGATPVFCDVEKDTWCLRVDQIEQHISPRTKALIAVDLYGNMPDWEPLLQVAKKHGLFVIEDAAQAIGSLYHTKPAGSFGNCSVFSFHGSKTLTTGEGGMLVTNDLTLYQRILQLRDHGRRPGDTEFFNDCIGFKYKMSAMQAALGLSQLQRIDTLVNKKRAIYHAYQKHLREIAGLTLNIEPRHTYNAYWMTTLILDSSLNITTQTLRAQLKTQGVDTRPFFHPLSTLPAYQALYPERTAAPVAQYLSTYGFNLPSALCLSEQDIAQICDIIKKNINRLRQPEQKQATAMRSK